MANHHSIQPKYFEIMKEKYEKRSEKLRKEEMCLRTRLDQLKLFMESNQVNEGCDCVPEKLKKPVSFQCSVGTPKISNLNSCAIGTKSNENLLDSSYITNTNVNKCPYHEPKQCAALRKSANITQCTYDLPPKNKNINYVETLSSLVQAETDIQEKLLDLEKREHSYVSSAIQNLRYAIQNRPKDDPLRSEFNQMIDCIEEENTKLKFKFKNLRLELKFCLEMVEDSMTKRLDGDCKQQKELKELEQTENSLANEINDVKASVCEACCTMIDLNTVNLKLNSILNFLQKKCNNLENKLGAHEFKKAENLSTSEDECSCGNHIVESKKERGDDSSQGLGQLAKELEETLQQLGSDVADVPLGMKETLQDILDLIDFIEKKRIQRMKKGSNKSTPNTSIISSSPTSGVKKMNEKHEIGLEKSISANCTRPLRVRIHNPPCDSEKGCDKIPEEDIKLPKGIQVLCSDVNICSRRVQQKSLTSKDESIQSNIPFCPSVSTCTDDQKLSPPKVVCTSLQKELDECPKLSTCPFIADYKVLSNDIARIQPPEEGLCPNKSTNTYDLKKSLSTSVLPVSGICSKIKAFLCNANYKKSNSDIVHAPPPKLESCPNIKPPVSSPTSHLPEFEVCTKINTCLCPADNKENFEVVPIYPSKLASSSDVCNCTDDQKILAPEVAPKPALQESSVCSKISTSSDSEQTVCSCANEPETRTPEVPDVEQPQKQKISIYSDDQKTPTTEVVLSTPLQSHSTSLCSCTSDIPEASKSDLQPELNCLPENENENKAEEKNIKKRAIFLDDHEIFDENKLDEIRNELPFCMCPGMSKGTGPSEEIIAIRNLGTNSIPTIVCDSLNRENHKLYANTTRNLLDKPAEDLQVVTILGRTGSLEIVSEGPPGIIETKVNYLSDGKVEILTKIKDRKNISCYSQSPSVTTDGNNSKRSDTQNNSLYSPYGQILVNQHLSTSSFQINGWKNSNFWNNSHEDCETFNIFQKLIRNRVKTEKDEERTNLNESCHNRFKISPGLPLTIDNEEDFQRSPSTDDIETMSGDKKDSSSTDLDKRICFTEDLNEENNVIEPQCKIGIPEPSVKTEGLLTMEIDDYNRRLCSIIQSTEKYAQNQEKEMFLSSKPEREDSSHLTYHYFNNIQKSKHVSHFKMEMTSEFYIQSKKNLVGEEYSPREYTILESNLYNSSYANLLDHSKSVQQSYDQNNECLRMSRSDILLENLEETTFLPKETTVGDFELDLVKFKQNYPSLEESDKDVLKYLEDAGCYETLPTQNFNCFIYNCEIDQQNCSNRKNLEERIDRLLEINPLASAHGLNCTCVDCLVHTAQTTSSSRCGQSVQACECTIAKSSNPERTDKPPKNPNKLCRPNSNPDELNHDEHCACVDCICNPRNFKKETNVEKEKNSQDLTRCYGISTYNPCNDPQIPWIKPQEITVMNVNIPCDCGKECLCNPCSDSVKSAIPPSRTETPLKEKKHSIEPSTDPHLGTTIPETWKNVVGTLNSLPDDKKKAVCDCKTCDCHPCGYAMKARPCDCKRKKYEG